MAIDLFAFVGIGVSAFIATNIDDIFVLMLFFTFRRFHRLVVVAGQYLGIGTLVAISTVGSLLALVVPQVVIGLLGLVPISIGSIRLIQLRKHQEELSPNEIRSSRWQHHFSLLAVAAVTISNGGDNIGIYVPLFAKYSAMAEILVLVTIFMIMTGVWCLMGYYLVYHRLLAARFRQIGEKVFPFVLIGLGVYIIIHAFSCFSLMYCSLIHFKHFAY